MKQPFDSTTLTGNSGRNGVFSKNSRLNLYAWATNLLYISFALPSEKQKTTAITTKPKINLMMSETRKNITLHNNQNNNNTS